MEVKIGNTLVNEEFLCHIMKLATSKEKGNASYWFSIRMVNFPGTDTDEIIQYDWQAIAYGGSYQVFDLTTLNIYNLNRSDLIRALRKWHDIHYSEDNDKVMMIDEMTPQDADHILQHAIFDQVKYDGVPGVQLDFRTRK